jgi:hypothetical protein
MYCVSLCSVEGGGVGGGRCRRRAVSKEGGERSSKGESGFRGRKEAQYLCRSGPGLGRRQPRRGHTGPLFALFERSSEDVRKREFSGKILRSHSIYYIKFNRDYYNHDVANQDP